jgi:hypothetical protein
MWARFHCIDDTLYSPIGNLDVVADLLCARLGEFHRKNKEQLELVFDRTHIAVIVCIARVLQQPFGHFVLLDRRFPSGRALCMLSGFVAECSVSEMPAFDSAESGEVFLKAAAYQCVERNMRVAVIIREEALVHDKILSLVASLSQGCALSVFEETELLSLARKACWSLPISAESNILIIESYASEALQKNFKIILVGSSDPSSPIAAIPHLSTNFTFHSVEHPQIAYFSAALQATLGSGFAEFAVDGMKAEDIAGAFNALRDAVVLEAERTCTSDVKKQLIVSADSCFRAVQVFSSELVRRKEKIAESISMAQSFIANCAAVVKHVEELDASIRQMRQQVEHAKLNEQDMSTAHQELAAAAVCSSRPPLELFKAELSSWDLPITS